MCQVSNGSKIDAAPLRLKELTKVLSSLGQQSLWREALQRLCELQECTVEPGVIAHNAVLTACVRAKRWELALTGLETIQVCGLRADSFTLAAGVTAGGNGERWELALKQFSEILRQKLRPGVIEFGAATSACEKSGGQWVPALALLLSLRVMGLEASIVACNSAISACGKGGSSSWRCSQLLLSEMSLLNLTWSEATLASSIAACRTGRNWEAALASLAEMQRQRMRCSGVVFGSTIAACAENGHWELALLLLGQMYTLSLTPNNIICSMVMTACGREPERWKQAAHLLEDFSASRGQMDCILVNTAMDVCSQRWQCALQLLAAACRSAAGPVYDLVSYNTMAASCARSASWQTCLKLLSLLQGGGADASGKDGGLRPDAASFGSAITACAECSWERSLSLQAACSSSHRVVVHTAAMAACSKGQQWASSTSLLMHLRSNGLEPDAVVFGSLAAACAAGQQWRYSVQHLANAQSIMLCPDSAVHNAVLAACDKAEEWMPALALLAHIGQAGLQRDLASFVAACGACVGDGWHKAINLLRVSARENLVPGIEAYCGALAASARVAQVQASVLILDEMRLRGIRPNILALGSLVEASRTSSRWDSLPALLRAVKLETVAEILPRRDAPFTSVQTERTAQRVYCGPGTKRIQ
eukprot:TRINITY_DN25795_c0_g1_i1.p1 TRINITY_DN25795_c0_g1~~TRINITY_DN25795_c0_g1_i1.p1  ORF type:complete len:650 (-),score=129.51 TRINITY_DN25795_c0_g1_i1:17-1966(-)